MKPIVIIVTASAVLFGGILPGQSDESESTTHNADPFHPKTTVVVTATRSELEIDKSPMSTSVVTLKELEVRPMQTLDQNLALIEGLYIYRTQGPSASDAQASLRGFNGSARTLVLLDGHPVNDAYSSGVNWTGLPVNEVQSVEVARGPFSSLYGGNALGGVIHIITRPVERRELAVVGEYGTYNTSNYSARYSDRFFQKLGLSLSYQRFQTGGYNSRVTTATPASATSGTLVTGPMPSLTSTGTPAAIIGQGGLNWLNKHSYRLKADYAFTGSTVASLQYIRQDYGYGYTGYRSYLRDANGNTVDGGAFVFNNRGVLQQLSISPTSFLQGPGEQHSHFFSATVQHQFSSVRSLRLDASYYSIPSYQFRSVGTGATEVQGPGTNTDGVRRSYHGHLQYRLSAKANNLTVGAETRHDIAANETFGLGNWLVKESRLNQTFLALGRSINQSAYLQDQIAISDRLSLVAGARYDYWRAYDGQSNSFNANAPLTLYPERSNNRVTAKIALAYNLPRNWNLRFSAGSAFRNPNVFDLYATSVSGSGTIFRSNPALTPEKVSSWEAGARKRFGERTDFDVAYYENYITGLIYRQTDLVADPSGRIRVNINAGGGRTRGLEAAGRQQLLPGLQFRAAYSYTNALITRNAASPATVGKPVTFIPEHMASGQLIGIHAKWTGTLTGRYSAAVFSTDTGVDTTKGVPGAYDPFFVMDSTVGYSINSRWQLFVTSENLLNRRYYLFYLSPGRTIYSGIRIRL